MLYARPIGALVALWTAVTAFPVRAGTFLYEQFGPTTERAGVARFLTPADGDFHVRRTGLNQEIISVVITPLASPVGVLAFAYFGPPEGQPLAPGSYDGARRIGGTDHPTLDIDSRVDTCDGPGRFDLYEVTLDAGGELVAFSLDFEVQCIHGVAVGALRFRAGDGPCDGAGDGTPCDDRNPCTENDACHGGTCEGLDTASVSCAQSGQCVEGGTCDRRTGGCVTLDRHDGAECDDGDACTSTAACQAGVCIGAGDPPDCDDESVCTTDRCDPVAGCVHDPVPGVCLVTRPVVRSVATGSANGQSARCTLRCQSPDTVALILYNDGTYLSPGGTAACPTGARVTFPDEVGTVRRARRNAARLIPSNREELLDATEACSGVRPRAYRTRILGGGGGAPREITNVASFVLRRRIPVAVTTRLHGRLVPGVVSSGAVQPPATNPDLPVCSELLRPRCVTD